MNTTIHEVSARMRAIQRRRKSTRALAGWWRACNVSVTGDLSANSQPINSDLLSVYWIHLRSWAAWYKSGVMNAVTQQAEFLSWKVAPARLNATQAAWYLGFEPHEITILVGAGVLKPLGHPARNSTKYFATEILEQLRHDEKWLARATDAIANYWKQRNARKKTASERHMNGNRIPGRIPVLDSISPP